MLSPIQSDQALSWNMGWKDKSVTVCFHKPRTFLLVVFCAWKLLLVSIALASPGPGYDTSTTLVDIHASTESSLTNPSESSTLVHKFVRWDAIYFTQISSRGYLFEQEWAFGWGHTSLISLLSRGLQDVISTSGIQAVSGILIASLTHMASVLMLHSLTLSIFSDSPPNLKSRMAVLAASLHIFNPAGMFLVAPYAESSFSFLNFLGLSLYAKSFKADYGTNVMCSDFLLLLSGVAFGIASLFRGNGLFSGSIFVYDTIVAAVTMCSPGDSVFKIRRLLVVILVGTLMGFIAFGPQYLAYEEFCTSVDAKDSRRPWCSSWVPSVYAWVQKTYWGVGFLQYWTVSNIPLFLLATPMLCILFVSGCMAFSNRKFAQRPKTSQQSKDGQARMVQSPSIHGAQVALLRRFAAPQLILAVLALTTYHVQVITRLSSGYPLWYWWLAEMIAGEKRISKYSTRWMIVYVLVQGGLFASFLPPA